MIRIGIVGDIGSGKSYIAKQFGRPVFDADAEVAKLYKKSKKCYKKLKKKLPDHINSFPVKKNRILESIASNNNNLKKIIKIIHPEIIKKLNFFLKKNKNKKIVVLDIPLLIENNLNKKNDIIIFIDAPKKEINKRLKKRANYNQKIIQKFKKLQLTVEFKKKKANFIIKNNFKINSAKKNVKKLIKKILLNA